MQVCVECRKEMRNIETGVGVNFGHGHVYSGDIWACPECDKQVIITAGQPNRDVNYVQHNLYLNMDPDSSKWK